MAVVHHTMTCDHNPEAPSSIRHHFITKNYKIMSKCNKEINYKHLNAIFSLPFYSASVFLIITSIFMWYIDNAVSYLFM